MIIRNVVENDLNKITELWIEFMDYHKILDSSFTRAEYGHEEFYKSVINKLADADWKIIVAEIEKKIVGYCIAGIQKLPPVFKFREYGYIQDIAVAQNHRNLGIGKQLFERVRDWFQEKNINRIELNVLANNEETVKFWTNLGFKLFTERMFNII